MAAPLHATLDDLTAAAVNALVDQANGLIEGANADVARFANAILADAVEAAAAGRLDLVNDLTSQTAALLEANRLRVVAGLETTLVRVLSAVLGVVVRIALPTIPTIPQL